MSLPLINTFPSDLISLKIAKMSDVFPDPDSPTIPILSPFLRVKLKFFIALT